MEQFPPNNSFLQNVLTHIVNQGFRNSLNQPPSSRYTLTRSYGQQHSITCTYKSRGPNEDYKGAKALTHLNLEGDANDDNLRISQILTNVFAQFSSLKFLKLSNNKFSGDIGNKFNNLTNLEELYLDNNNIIGRTNQIDLYNCKNLTKLAIGNNELSDYEYERRQLRSTIPWCEIDFGNQRGNEFKQFIHLTYVQVENKIYDHTSIDEATIYDYDHSQWGKYDGMHTMAIIDLKVDQANDADNDDGHTVEIIKWHGYNVDNNNTDLRKKLLEYAEKCRCTIFCASDFRPFVLVKHIGYGTKSQQKIFRYSDLNEALYYFYQLKFTFDMEDYRSTAVYDLRNVPIPLDNLSNKREVIFHGVRETSDGYKIEGDFRDWMKELVFSFYFKKSIKKFDTRIVEQ